MTSAPVLQRTPVALFVFNRPAFTARVFEMIAQARPARLLVVGDGPRADHPDDVDLVRETREIVERVDWRCELQTCYSDVNLGCGRRVASGLDWVFANVDEAIILEDDCVPDPTFFPYCEELLERYRDDERVHMVSGCNVMAPKSFGPYSYYFSRCYHIWGWATWSLAWSHYDYEMRDWPPRRETSWLEQHLRSKTAARIAGLLFDETYAGRIRQWDFQWVFAGWSRNAVSVTPAVNLVTNIGFGDAATHLVDPNHPRANLESLPMSFPLRHPPEVKVLEEADRAEWESVFPHYPQFAGHRLRRGLMGALRRGHAALGRPAGFGRGTARSE
jgi:hypothetical protein